MIRVLIVKSEKILIAILVLMDNENINQAIKLYPNDHIVEIKYICCQIFKGLSFMLLSACKM